MEGHKLSAKNRKEIKELSNGAVLLLTGTLRLKSEKTLRNDLGLGIIVEYDLERAIEDGLVKDYILNIHFVKMDNVNRIYSYKKFGRDTLGTEKEVYLSLSNTMDYAKQGMESIEAKNPDKYLLDGEWKKFKGVFDKYMGLRTNFIYNSKRLLDYSNSLVQKYKDEKCLIFSLRTNVADQLSEVVHHSKNNNKKELEEFKLSEGGHLSTVGMISEGITIKNLNHIICHTVSSNTEDFQQKLGRGLQLGEGYEKCIVDVVVLDETQQVTWLEQACKSLSQFKINYIINGVSIPKIDYMKNLYSDKELYLFRGGYCYPVGTNDFGQIYKFIGSDKEYNLPFNKLKKL